jgi:hypothetical protein
MLLPCLLDDDTILAPTPPSALPERLFIFGSLMDVDLFRLVLDRDIPDLVIQPAIVAGFRRRRARGECYPILVPHPDGHVEGLVIEGLTLNDLDRLQYYETGDYRLEWFDVQCGDARLPAHLFYATGRLEPSNDGWDLAAWQILDKPYFMAIAAALMAHYGRTPLCEVESRWEDIKANALSNLCAEISHTRRVRG